jgi:Protein of unknown function (DUF3027)
LLIVSPLRGRSKEPDEACVQAVDLARTAAEDLAGPAAVGEHVGVTAEGDRVVTHLFGCLDPAYRGWCWAVTVARASRAKLVTVNECLLLPGPEAILAPDWVPWRERLRPGDLGVGDILPAPPDDPRLAPAATLEGDDGLTDWDEVTWVIPAAAPVDLLPAGPAASAELAEAGSPAELAGAGSPAEAESPASPGAGQPVDGPGRPGPIQESVEPPGDAVGGAERPGEVAAAAERPREAAESTDQAGRTAGGAAPVADSATAVAEGAAAAAEGAAAAADSAAQAANAGPAGGDPQLAAEAASPGLDTVPGRARVLSAIGRDEAALRWYTSEHGPKTPLAHAAPGVCSGCGFFTRLAGPLGRVFGVCANAYAPDDGRVVSADHGCGAHSEAVFPASPEQPLRPVIDELGYDLVDMPGVSVEETVFEPLEHN